jgi:hypothetical protein
MSEIEPKEEGKQVCKCKGEELEVLENPGVPGKPNKSDHSTIQAYQTASSSEAICFSLTVISSS